MMNKRISAILAMLLVLMLALPTIAVAQQLNTPPAGMPLTAVEDTLTVAMVSEASQLDPQGNAVTQPDAIVNLQIYEGLVRMNNATKEIEPLLAKSWEQIDDKTIRFHLNEGVKFHDGTEFTAEDVLFAAQRGVVSTSKQYCWSAVDADNCEVVDKYTIDIRTYEPYPVLMAMMADNGAVIISKNYFESVDYNTFIRNPMGTGPWAYNEWIAGDSISFTRNEEYWGQKPHFANLVIRTISDDTTRAMALETGEIDYAIDIIPSQIDYLRDNPGVNIFAFPGMTTEYVGFNCTREELSDVRVRQAMRYAIDLDNMVNIAYGVGLTADVADGIYTAANQFYAKAEGEYIYSYDLEKAKALMAEAGYADGFDVKIICRDASARIAMTEMLKNAWENIGINVEISVMDIGSYYNLVEAGETDLFLGGVVCLANDGDLFHDIFYSTQGRDTNFSQYKSEEYDRLADEGRYEMDHDKRKVIYTDLQNLLRKDLPWMPIAFAYETCGVRSTLTGMDLSPNGQPVFQFVRPADAA